MRIVGHDVLVVDRGTLVATKWAAGRPEDLETAAELEDHLKRRGSP